MNSTWPPVHASAHVHVTNVRDNGIRWGVARKINYTGDWLMGLAWCAVTGFNTIITYFYAIYFAVLLVHRAIRDDDMCQRKYEFCLLHKLPLSYSPLHARTRAHTQRMCTRTHTHTHTRTHTHTHSLSHPPTHSPTQSDMYPHL